MCETTSEVAIAFSPYTQSPYRRTHIHTKKHIHGMQAGLSEPEDSMTSDVESFDEEDMCPANYNDESVSESPDSDSDGESQSRLMEPVYAFLFMIFLSPNV
jgi:hypothetical protein